ncbi:MAG: hypothetical protein KDA85_16365 [Planctomycetaceae bacterium]|nr:hypothetical protein [Planctomycetaceae bacterium]
MFGTMKKLIAAGIVGTMMLATVGVAVLPGIVQNETTFAARYHLRTRTTRFYNRSIPGRSYQTNRVGMNQSSGGFLSAVFGQ